MDLMAAVRIICCSLGCQVPYRWSLNSFAFTGRIDFEIVSLCAFAERAVCSRTQYELTCTRVEYQEAIRFFAAKVRWKLSAAEAV